MRTDVLIKTRTLSVGPILLASIVSMVDQGRRQEISGVETVVVGCAVRSNKGNSKPIDVHPNSPG